MMVEPDRTPSELRVFFGGFHASTFRLELTNGVLLYGADRQPLEPLEPQPTLQQWKAFRDALDSAKVWSWQASYHDPTVLDGIQWELKVVYRDRRLDSAGSNRYPGSSESHPMRAGKAFTKMLAACSALAGGRPFG